MSDKSELLYQAICNIDDEIIASAAAAKSVKKRRTNPIKWLSVAACFILVAGIGVGVWRSGITGPSSAVSNDDPPKVSDNITEPPENTDPVDSPAVTDTQPKPDTDDSPIGGGSEFECPLHGLGTYTAIPMELVNYVGQENFDIWAEPLRAVDYDNQRTDGCICIGTLPDFIEHFDIPNDVIIDYYYNKGGYYTDDWDLDIILAHDWDAFDEYAQAHQGFDEEMMKRENERRFKRELLNSIENSTDEEIKAYWNELTENGTKKNYAKWSIADFVDKTGIDIMSLTSILASVSVNSFTGESHQMFEYDFSSLYEPEGNEVSIMNSGNPPSDTNEELYPVLQDALLHK